MVGSTMSDIEDEAPNLEGTGHGHVASMRLKIGLGFSAFSAYLLICGALSAGRLDEISLRIAETVGLAQSPPGMLVIVILPTSLLILLTLQRRRDDAEDYEKADAPARHPSVETTGAIPKPAARKVKAPPVEGPKCQICGRPLYRVRRCGDCGGTFCPQHFKRRKHDCPEPSTSQGRWRLLLPLLLVLLLLGPAFYYSRESPMKIAFSRSCGDNESQECYSVAEGDDGAYVVVGENEGITEDDTGMYLVKIDGKGSLMWEMKKYAVSTDYQTRIVPVGDGFVVLAEKWGSPYLVRIDGDGATLWERMYEENLTADYFATSIASHPRGGFLVVGEVQNYETEMVDCFAWMIGTMGERVWERIYPGDGEDHPTCVVAAEGGFVILGVSNSTEDEGMYRIYLRKIDDGGKELWCRAITGVFPYQTWQGLEAHQLICCADGGFAMAGWIDSTYLDPSSQTRSDAYIIRTDAHGEVIWERTYGTERNERAFSIVETEDRGFLVAGWARREQVADPTGPMRIDTYLLRVSARGEEIWSRRIRRGARDLTANAMIRSTDGGYVVVGCKEFRTSRDACGLIWQPDFHILKIREEEWTPIPKCSPYLLVVAGSLAVVVQLAIRRKHKWQTEG